jgi:cation transport ATPase
MLLACPVQRWHCARAVQAAENEEKRKKAAERLKTAYDTNVALLEKKRQDYYKRERANAERRKKQEEEREAADREKRAQQITKAEKRKARARASPICHICFLALCLWVALFMSHT